MRPRSCICVAAEAVALPPAAHALHSLVALGVAVGIGQLSGSCRGGGRGPQARTWCECVAGGAAVRAQATRPAAACLLCLRCSAPAGATSAGWHASQSASCPAPLTVRAAGAGPLAARHAVLHALARRDRLAGRPLAGGGGGAGEGGAQCGAARLEAAGALGGAALRGGEGVGEEGRGLWPRPGQACQTLRQAHRAGGTLPLLPTPRSSPWGWKGDGSACWACSRWARCPALTGGVEGSVMGMGMPLASVHCW